MLQSFLALFPKSSAYAYDVSSHNRALFAEVAKEFYTSLNAIKQKFDFISAVYCVEHFCEVKKEILAMRELLNDDGVLMVQVPDIEQNLWDIFTYDHIHHFSRDSLRNLLCPLGFCVMFPSVQLDRGITLLAKKDGKSLGKSSSFVYPKERIQAHFSVLDRIVESGEKVAVFGSAINSTFIAGYLEGSLAAFLDEDVRKIGKEHLGVRIIPPSAWDKKVIMPYGHIKDKVQAKYHFNAMVEVY
ncbi:methyltransferase domain-containing protein [Helicobacter sp.]|uniref:methyltransferase domain-containing protein n=1 Tax=Helicobacter sp. TaxID=218 RepID=UPI0025BEA4A0|nr:methyltransferase domain-containing protein [Helicobacter sp.]MCI5968199.1 class I SAM-dependent methyltransferase [Helicobacter sp.]MDY2585311.1 methyltransferase domain-containing protein [Helicobacter sp.]